MSESSCEVQMLYLKLNGKEDKLPFILLVQHQVQ